MFPVSNSQYQCDRVSLFSIKTTVQGSWGGSYYWTITVSHLLSQNTPYPSYFWQNSRLLSFLYTIGSGMISLPITIRMTEYKKVLEKHETLVLLSATFILSGVNLSYHWLWRVYFLSKLCHRTLDKFTIIQSFRWLGNYRSSLRHKHSHWIYKSSSENLEST